MRKRKIKDYLFDLNSQDLTYAYVAAAEPLVGDKSSNHIKFDVYSKAFDMEFRKKYTGFEKLHALDIEARNKINQSLILDDIDKTPPSDKLVSKSYSMFLKNKKLLNSSIEQKINVYRQELIEKAKKFKGQPNIIYFSGGADSELVARSFVEAGVDFVPVIFDYVNDNDEILNSFDTEWADKFCERFNLAPVRRSFNVEKFWKSEELLEIAKFYKEDSPQLCVYHKMIDLVHAEIELSGLEKFSSILSKKISITSLNFASETQLQEIAQDIWTVPFFSKTMCQEIVDLLEGQYQKEFVIKEEDYFPTPELEVENFDTVLMNATEQYYLDTIRNTLSDIYSIPSTPISAQYISKICSLDEYFDIHHDLAKFAMTIKLNDNFEGGDLYFPRQNFSAKNIPIGNILIWPGQVTHPYTVKPVTKGNRYAYNLLVPTIHT
jgi:hypothetical protein